MSKCCSRDSLGECACKKFTASTPEEIKVALEDPNKIVTEVNVTIDNKDKKADDPVTEEGFEISRDLLVAMYHKAKESNASVKIKLSKCAKLGNATVTIIVEPS